MLFNSLIFLAFFLPITLLFYFGLPPKFRIKVICISSLIFYFYSGFVPGISLSLTLVLCFICYRYKSFFYIAGIVFPLSILIFYKYYDFFFTELINYFEMSSFKKSNMPIFLQIILPAGISFYTFQIISFIIDNKRKKEKISFENFCAYITFFPQLIAGPIVRWHQIGYQLQNVKENKLIINLFDFLKFFVSGLFMKVFLADTCQKFTYFYVESFKIGISSLKQINFLDYFLYNFYLSFQIYFDFFAYSLMAIGLGKLFGISLPKNFDEPYRSKNIKEFWRRWHITLSNWIKDYLYIPLNGSKKYVRNILVVFAICGLWHGASLNFILWGLYHGSLVVLYKFFQKEWNLLNQNLQILFTFIIVSLAWPLFDLQLNELNYILSNLNFEFNNFLFNEFHYIKKIIFFSYIFILFYFTFMQNFTFSIYQGVKANKLNVLILASCTLLSIIFINWSKTFIYFRF